MNVLQQLPRTEPDVDGQRFLMCGVDWRTYEKFLDAIGDRHIRVTYDRGEMELMSPSPEHEQSAETIGFFVRMLAYGLKIPFKVCGSTTFRRKDVERGLEPDRCFYFRNAARILGKKRINLTRDPPPDLAIEIDITHSWLDRMGIYAALRVPEVWCFDGETIRVYRLRKTGAYVHSKRSLAFPSLPIEEFTAFLQRTAGLNDMELTGAVLDWVEEHVRSLQQRPQ